MSMEKLKVNLNLGFFLIILSCLIGILFLYQIRGVLILVFLAYLLMIALTPIREIFIKFFKLKKNSLWSVFLTYFLVVGVLLLTIFLFFPILIRQMIDLVNILLNLIAKSNLDVFKEIDFSKFQLNYDQVLNFFSQFNNLFSKLGATFNIFFQIFAISIMSFYMMNDKKIFYKKFYWFTKDENLIKKIKKFFQKLEEQLGGWVRGQLILMLTIGIITYIGLFLFDLPYALALAILAGLLEALPGIGPTLSSIPAIIFALFFHEIGSVDWLYGSFIALFYFVVQQVENTFLVPKIMSDNTQINPLVSLVAILIGFEIGGVFGALLALPTLIIVRCIYQVYNEH